MTSATDSSCCSTVTTILPITTTTATSSTVMSSSATNNKPALIHSMKQEQQQQDPNQVSLGNTSSCASSSSPQNSSSSSSSSSTPQKICYACNKVIYERFLLKAMDEFWHEDCLKCSCCGCRLGEVGSTLFTKANLILCKRDYLRLFGSTGTCLVCDGNIPAFELVMKVRGHNMHLECFKCQECNHRFCVGDKFYLYNNTKILCEYHYEERMVFANLPQNSLEQIKRSTNEFLEAGAGSDGASSGYGSHSESPYTEHR